MTARDMSIRGCLSDGFRDSVVVENARPMRHLERISGIVRVVDDEELPAEMAWHTVEQPRRLRRVIELYDHETLRFFLTELLQYEDDKQHHGRITIENTGITIEINTHGINDITDIDREYAKMIDLIFDDAMEFKNRRDASIHIEITGYHG